MKENEKNDFCLTNPDGKIQNVFESKNSFSNESKNFAAENNVSRVHEQEYIQERFIESKPKAVGKDRGTTTNLNAVSSFFATTTVAVASTVVIAVTVIVATLVGAQLYATTSDVLTFYVQSYLDEEHTYIARLYSEEDMVGEMPIEEPFVEFFELSPDCAYTFEIIDGKSEEVVFTQEYKTAPQDSYSISFEAWIEGNTLTINTYLDQDFPNVENIESYMISVYDNNGDKLYEQTVEKLDLEYTISLPDNNTTTPTSSDKPNTADLGDDSGQGFTNGDDVVLEEEQDEVYYVGIVYQKDGYTIGSVQRISKRGW